MTIVRDGGISIILMLCTMFFIKKKIGKVGIWTGIGVILFTVAMVLIFHVTGVSPMSGFHLEIRWKEVEWVPFVGIYRMITSSFALVAKGEGSMYQAMVYLALNIFGNIILFAPIGYFLPLLFKKFERFGNTVLLGFLLSLMIEVTQLFLIRGTDVNDLILNTLGGMFGFLCYLIFKKLFPKWSEKFNVDGKIESRGKVIIGVGCILLPYFVVVILGFYDRMQFFSFVS